MPIDDKNPYTPTQVMDMFIADEECQHWFKDGVLALMVIPNIEGVYYGRDVGYKIEQVDLGADIHAISATEKRKQLGI